MTSYLSSWDTRLPHDISYRHPLVQIGCKVRTPKQWLRLTDRLGVKHGYTKYQISKVRRIIKAIQELQDAVQ